MASCSRIRMSTAPRAACSWCGIARISLRHNLPARAHGRRTSLFRLLQGVSFARWLILRLLVERARTWGEETDEPRSAFRAVY